jgi:cell division septation protein DedD
VTAHTHDDAFHEIQLNGKQLVFLVMVVTIVGVSIFLLGVLVGRNVRAQRAGLAPAGVNVQMPAADILPPAQDAQEPPPQADADPRAAAPPPTADDPESRTGEVTAAEVLKPAAPRPDVPVAEARPVPAARPAERTPAPPKPKPQPAATAAKAASAPAAVGTAATEPPPGNGFAVQVAALNARSEADAIARRLSAKGYAAYVQVPTSGSVFRVRVGTFKTRREADAVAARLQKEEQFKPWVTR